MIMFTFRKGRERNTQFHGSLVPRRFVVLHRRATRTRDDTRGRHVSHRTTHSAWVRGWFHGLKYDKRSSAHTESCTAMVNKRHITVSVYPKVVHGRRENSRGPGQIFSGGDMTS